MMNIGLIKKMVQLQVFGYVDAQNSFGAMIRSNFVLKYDCVAQKEISIEFDGKVYQYQ